MRVISELEQALCAEKFSKGVGMKDQVSTYLETSLRECYENRTLSLKYC